MDTKTIETNPLLNTLNTFHKNCYEDVCRTCLKSNDSFISIFSNRENCNKTFAEMIMDIAPIQITSDQKFTTNLCAMCADSVYKLYNFQQQCIQADTIIRGEFDGANSASKFNIFIKHETVETYDNTNSRDYDMPFNNWIKEESNIEIPEYNASDSLISNLESKPKEEITSSDKKIKKRQNITRNTIHSKLPDYNANSRRRYLINAAIIEHKGEKPNHCGTCNVTVKSYRLYRQHVIRKHVDEPAKLNIKTCDICGKVISRNNFLRHRTSCLGIRFECEICLKSYTQKADLTQHMLIHTIGKKYFCCELCSQQYACKRNLIIHRFKSHGIEENIPIGIKLKNKKEKSSNKNIELVKCPLCNKTLKRTALSNHKAHVHNDDYLCHICGARFKQIVTYNTHLLLHKGEKPFKCKYCSQTFRQRAHVKRHERLHTGEKPFKCEYCLKSFRHQTTYLIHVRTHTGEKPYKCRICNRGFGHITNMKKHLLSHE